MFTRQPYSMKYRIIVLLTTLLTACSLTSQVDVFENKVGINMIEPAHDVHIKGSDFLFEDRTGLEVKMYIGDDGKVGIGTMSPTEAIDLYGNIAITHPLNGSQDDGRCCKNDNC